MKTMTKLRRCWKSKTVQFNAAGILMLGYVSEQMPNIQQYLGQTAAMWIFGGVFVANIALRFFTDKGLDQK